MKRKHPWSATDPWTVCRRWPKSAAVSLLMILAFGAVAARAADRVVLCEEFTNRY